MPARLELWQTEWCPASHRVRQRLTELGLSYVVRQVPVQRAARSELRALAGDAEIPVLVADDALVRGERAILAHLERSFPEPPGAEEQRVKAARAERRQLEEACRELAAATR